MAELGERQTAPFPAAAEAALLKGNKIEAIKIVRSERGVDLKDAKDIVEQHVATHPGLQMQMESAQAAKRQGFLPWLMAVIVIGALVYYFVTGR
jgi:ribosomal protein L7/L12